LISRRDADQKGSDLLQRAGARSDAQARSIVPIAPWLKGLTGKVIGYRAPTSAKTRAAGGPDYFEKPVADLGKSFEACLIDAGEAHPERRAHCAHDRRRAERG
jgi:hypothetical protein